MRNIIDKNYINNYKAFLFSFYYKLNLKLLNFKILRFKDNENFNLLYFILLFNFK